MVETLNLEQVLNADDMAVRIAAKYNEWQGYRTEWMKHNTELRKYLFATDTSYTEPGKLPWKNRTTRPKLTQIRDNLHANYKATLFPQSKWLDWISDEPTDQFKKKAAIAYLESKINHPESNFYNLVDQLLYDYIDTGVVFASGNNYRINRYDNGSGTVVTYKGPMIKRYSSYDVVMNPTATSALNTPKIVRSLWAIGDLIEEIDSTEDYNKDAFKKALRQRREIIETVESQSNLGSLEEGYKDSAFRVDGFGSLYNYYSSDMTELLTFYGDLYITETGEFKKNRIIVVMDRTTILMDIENPTNNGSQMIRYVGWRPRPDNLYAMGPLHNLVGLQYRLDHLENSQADLMDMSTFPMVKIRGEVEEFNYGPLEEVICGDDGDVDFIFPSQNALGIDLKMERIEQTMEEMAGAPKQAMGFRTPGEKTKFEVQILENNANRLFLHKVAWFEQNFLEPLLNDMFEAGVRNIEESGEEIMYLNDQGVPTPIEITKDDLNAKGRFRPVGARNFIEKANQLQNLTQIANTPILQMIQPHISTWEMAKTLESLLDLDRINPNVISKDIALNEQETQGQPGGPGTAQGLPPGAGGILPGG